MKPLTVTAHLAKPPAVDQSIYLDAILLAGLGHELGSAEPGGWVEPPEVVRRAESEPGLYPLARVETPAGWWWAASSAPLVGPERREHLHRRPPLEAYSRLTDRQRLDHKTGPDKTLRVPFFYRPEMLTITWTCVGDRARVEALLTRVPAVGRFVAHGWGWVRWWQVRAGGPSLRAYAFDLSLRHLPVDLDPDVRQLSRWTNRRIPLRPPYYRRTEGVPCIQSL